LYYYFYVIENKNAFSDDLYPLDIFHGLSVYPPKIWSSDFTITRVSEILSDSSWNFYASNPWIDALKTIIKALPGSHYCNKSIYSYSFMIVEFLKQFIKKLCCYAMKGYNC
jgi:hypothetical protein